MPAQPSKPPRQLDLLMLGTRLRVTTDDEWLARRIETELRSFFADDAPRSDAAGPELREIEVRAHPPPPRARTAQGSFELDPGEAAEQAYGLVFREALDGAAGHLVLHAAALERRGQALLLAGPTHAGKTTLALGLLDRGFRLLSDDFSPIERESGRIEPFLKALGIRPGPGRHLARLPGSVESAPPREPLQAQRLAPQAVAERPAAPAAVLLFDGGERPPGVEQPYRYVVTLAGDAQPLARLAAEIPGVRVESAEEGDLVVAIDPRARGARRFEELVDRAGAHVLEYGSLPRRAASRSSRAHIVPIRPATALLLLVRDLQNRRPGGALLASLGDDPAALTFAVARALSGVSFGWLVPGPVPDTVDAIDRWLAGLHGL
jgi:hypothetical protein